MKLILVLAACLAASGARGQDVKCRACHTSDSPTKLKPALVDCPRAQAKGSHSPSEGPRVITLGKAGARYAPVKFPHEAHARMSEMDGGCFRCHHYDRGGRIQKCGDCHSETRVRADLGKPDLRGALHRLCVDCHRERSHTTDCGGCHGAKPRAKKAMPASFSYRARSGKGKAAFPHADHVRLYGLDCAACHQGESCGSCHDPEGMRPVRTDDRCASCHPAEGPN